jgi:hypothetical protein
MSGRLLGVAGRKPVQNWALCERPALGNHSRQRFTSASQRDSFISVS